MCFGMLEVMADFLVCLVCFWLWLVVFGRVLLLFVCFYISCLFKVVLLCWYFALVLEGFAMIPSHRSGAGGGAPRQGRLQQTGRMGGRLRNLGS